MIQFIELVPVEVDNENWEEEQDEFLNSREFCAVPPQKRFIRHENKFLAKYEGPFIGFEGDELLVIEGNKYRVQFVGPKEFGETFSQTIYVEKLP